MNLCLKGKQQFDITPWEMQNLYNKLNCLSLKLLLILPYKIYVIKSAKMEFIPLYYNYNSLVV